MKIKEVKVKKSVVRYWNFEFLNWKGERMFYHCVAPNFQLAYKSLLKYLDGCSYEVLSCVTDGETFCLQ